MELPARPVAGSLYHPTSSLYHPITQSVTIADESLGPARRVEERTGPAQFCTACNSEMKRRKGGVSVRKYRGNVMERMGNSPKNVEEVSGKYRGSFGEISRKSQGKRRRAKKTRRTPLSTPDDVLWACELSRALGRLTRGVSAAYLPHHSPLQ